MSENIYDVVKKAGEAANFSIVLNKDKSNPDISRKALEVARRFGEFAKWCVEQEVQLLAGVGEAPVVGPSGFINFTNKNGTSLMILVVPHDIIEVETQ